MVQRMKFGECLKELLLIRGWSAARLAKALNTDASYVRRWIRGERTPSLNSNFMELMVNALCENLDKDYKKAIRSEIEKVMDRTEVNWDRVMPVREMIQHLLHTSQVYTMSMDNEARKSVKATNQSHVMELLDKPGRSVSNKPLSSINLGDSLDGSFFTKVITGREALLKAAITLLKDSLDDGDLHDKGEIILTFLSEQDYFEGYDELHGYWQHLIILALNRGWTIKHLCKLNRNVERSLLLVNQIMSWTNYPGTYQSYYYDKYGIHNPPNEIIQVKGKGTLIGFASENHTEIDAGLYLNEPAAIQMIEKYVDQMFFNVEPLVKFLSINEYFDLNPVKDRKSGNHLLCLHDLSFLTIPFEIMEDYLHTSIPEENERRVHLKRIKDSLQSFERDIQIYKMRHIYPMSAIEQLIKTGSYIKNPYFKPTSLNIRDHLQHIILLLKTYEKFEIALVGDSQMELLNKTEWDVKGDHTIVIGIMPRNETDTQVELLAVTEGTIVSAFQEYFDDRWDRINPMYRDKEFVISWIERMLDHLQIES
jgi:hypothetical protein